VFLEKHSQGTLGVNRNLHEPIEKPALCVVIHNILQARVNWPFSTVQKSIQDPPPRWILTNFKLKFGGGNLFLPAMTSTVEGNNSGVTLGATVEEGDPRSGLKNVMIYTQVHTVKYGMHPYTRLQGHCTGDANSPTTNVLP
jgi:hypothetical protein